MRSSGRFMMGKARITTSLAMIVLAFAAVGCRSRPLGSAEIPPPPTTRPIEVLQKPAIDLTRGGAGFPLDVETAPTTIDELVTSLHRAYAARLEDDNNVRIDADGDSLGHLRSLTIDLTGSSVKGTFAPKPQPTTAPAVPYLRVEELRYIATPLKYQTYAGSVTLRASHAELALVRDTDKKLGLALYDCREGSAQLQVDLGELEKGLASAARLRNSLALNIQKVELRLRSQSQTNLDVEMSIRATVLLVPATFRLVGRADVDEQFNIHFSSLKAEGDSPSGAVLAAFVQGKLDALNNKAAPLLKLPGDKIRVSDLKITLDNRLIVDVKLAGTR